MTSESVQELVAGRRRWRLTAIGLLIALAATLAVSARADLPYPERVRARTVVAEEIVLKDSAGRVRVRMAVQGSAARLMIFDEDAGGAAGASTAEGSREVKQLSVASF